jgi:hypothetical protein
MLAFLCLFMLGIVGRGPVDDSTLHALHLKSDESIKDAKNDKKREPLYDSSIRALLKTRESDATGRRQRTTTKQNRFEATYAAREETLRFRWLGALVFQSGMMLMLGIYCWRLWYRYRKAKGEVEYWGWPLVPPIVVTILVFLIGNAAQNWLLPRNPLHLLLLNFMANQTGNSWLERATNIFNSLGGFVGWWVAIVLMDLVKRNAKTTEAGLNNSDAEFEFRCLLFLSAAFLVAVTLQIYCEFSWPSVLFPEKHFAKQLLSMAASGAFTYGAMFTVIAGFIFIPVAFILGTFKKLQVATIGQILAILAPLLAIPFARLFG